MLDNKGRYFDSVEAVPEGLKKKWGRRNTPLEVREEWVRAQNYKWEIVEVCKKCTPEHPLIREEIFPHLFSHIKSTRARVLARMLLADRTTKEDIEEALEVVKTWRLRG